MTRTALNLQVDRLIAHCKANGGHTPSQVTVTRDVGGNHLPLRVCAECQLPMVRRIPWTIAGSLSGRGAGE